MHFHIMYFSITLNRIIPSITIRIYSFHCRVNIYTPLCSICRYMLFVPFCQCSQSCTIPSIHIRCAIYSLFKIFWTTILYIFIFHSYTLNIFFHFICCLLSHNAVYCETMSVALEANEANPPHSSIITSSLQTFKSVISRDFAFPLFPSGPIKKTLMSFSKTPCNISLIREPFPTSNNSYNALYFPITSSISFNRLNAHAKSRNTVECVETIT